MRIRISIFIAVGIFLIASALIVFPILIEKKEGQTIKVGLLHSLTGTMAISEIPVVDATLLAIEEINKDGGIFGRFLEPVLADGASDWPTFALEAERLITEEKVSVIFGCWTSASRKKVKDVVEKYNHILFYPVQYEGIEHSSNIIYTGAAPNQQIIPAIKWSYDHLGKRFFLVGSDYVFPLVASEIIKKEIESLGGEIVGEQYIPLGENDVDRVIQKIADTKPDVILNTINGDTNVAFFKELKTLEGGSNNYVVSVSIGENEINFQDIENLEGSYAVWNYFQSIDSDTNHQFISRFKNRYGQLRVLSDPMEAAYFGVYLWKQAVESGKSSDPSTVLSFIGNQTFDAPEGVVYVDQDNHHVWKHVRVGKLKNNGQFEILWSSKQPVAPCPYPFYYQTKEEWDRFLHTLYLKWGNRWDNQSRS